MSVALAPRRVVLVACDGLQSLDLTGPLEVLHAASRGAGRDAYAIEVVTPGGRPVRSSSGLRITPDGAVGDVRGRVDTLIVAGGAGPRRAAAHDDRTVDHVRVIAATAGRVCSVCTGAFVLAAAGVLDGRRATTHWQHCATLAARHPEITVDPEPIFVRDGDVWTSAGVTAGIDLALALVEEDLGRRASLQVARELVVFLQRPGGQAQFSAPLAAQRAERRSLRELQAWIAEHLGSRASPRRPASASARSSAPSAARRA